MKILLITENSIKMLPPLMAILDEICENHEVTLVSRYENAELQKYYKEKGVTCISLSAKLHFSNAFLEKVMRRIHLEVFFPLSIKKIVKEINYDIIWIGSLGCAIRIKPCVKGKPYILNIYELYDRRKDLLEKVKPVAQNAKVVIVPEYNRANILKLWLRLKELPVVLPNKPTRHPMERFIPNEHLTERNKKIILYQGHIRRERNLNAICEATKDLPQYQLVLMGNKSEYLNELLKKYPHIKHLNYVTAPFHLNITSWAHIGIVTYDFYSLNALFCAPNKIWEYGGFGIPMIANDIPGLQYTVGKYQAGKCIDTNDVSRIKSAIIDIEKHYDEYSESALKLYNSCDIRTIINSVITKVEND